MRYAYYPGCSMDATAITYKKSIEYVTKTIGLELVEIADWNCCGATSGHTKGHWLALALPARNLALAEKQGLTDDIAIACASCYSRMKHTVHAARQSEETRKKIEEIIGMPYRAMADVKSFLEIFNQPEVIEACKAKMVRSLKGLKVACYYGCLTSRPRDVVGMEPSRENPMMMDNVVALTGAEPIVWDFKTECCGASHQVDAPDVSRPLIERILRNAKLSGAKGIVTACPLCNLNLDMREGEINKSRGTAFDLPIYQFTQLLAVCMGASANEAGLHKHFYPAYDRINEALRKAGEAV